MSVDTAIFSKPNPRHTKPLAAAISSPRTAPRCGDIVDLRRRVDEASRYIPLAQLAIGPQCGVSTNRLAGIIILLCWASRASPKSNKIQP
jgi:hypothetical protein